MVVTKCEDDSKEKPDETLYEDDVLAVERGVWSYKIER